MIDNNDAPERSAARSPKLLDQVRDRLRLKHYSLRTEQAYVGWIRRYIIFHNKRHPTGMGKLELRHSFAAHLLEGGYDIPAGARH